MSKHRYVFVATSGRCCRNIGASKYWYVEITAWPQLFNHIADFLNDRKARIKVNDLVGEWLDSTSGTSAGTVLGPILFNIAGEDIPKEIKPKFCR